MASLTPQQDRSRESLRRLLKAAAETLEEKGLEGATIPLIARRAGLSPGSVYRRFRDKDALLRTLMLETLQSSERRTTDILSPELSKSFSLEELARYLVRTTLESYRKHAGLMRALTQFVRSHSSVSFRKAMDEIEVRNFRQVVDFVLSKRAEITHPKPEKAASLALMTLAITLREIVILDVLSDTWAPILPKTDSDLVDQLTCIFLSYLKYGSGHPAR